MPASLSVNTTWLAQPTWLVMRRVIEAATDGLPAPDQHRIMNSLCDVDPFRRTPAPQNTGIVGCPPRRRFRCFAALRAWTESLLSTRQQATGAGLIGEVNALGNANVRSPCPGSRCSPPIGKALLAESARCRPTPPPGGEVRSSPFGLRKRPYSFTSRGTPGPGSPGPRASSFRRPCPCCAMPRPSSASSPRPTLPP